MNICIVSESDLSKPSGDVMRVISLASALGETEKSVKLIVPEPSDGFFAIDLDNVEVHTVPLKRKRGVVYFTENRLKLISKAKEIQKSTNSLLQIEFSDFCGFFALKGFSNYILDVHGLGFDEVRYSKLPWYVSSRLYGWLKYNLERLAVKRAYKVISVSNPMKQFFMREWKVPENKIEVIPNGYFESKIKDFETIKETKGMISFVGVLAGWATVGKVIEAARALKDADATFYIVGDGPYRNELENMVKKYKLHNVVFSGFVSIDKAYEIIAKSEITLLPLHKSLSKDVSSPVKLMDYIGLGKAMVIDNVSEMSMILKENNAALVSDHSNPSDFIENIRLLLNDSELRKEVASNAKNLAGDYTWQKQGEKLKELYKNLSQ